MTNMVSSGGKRYFITFIDDSSKHTYIFPLKTKDEEFEKFKSYKAKVKNLLNQKIKVLRLYRGSEYMGSEFIKLSEDCGIHREILAPYTPR